MTRCESVAPGGSLQCQDVQGHFRADYPHWADLGHGRALRWGVVETGCYDPQCARNPGHPMPHRDGKGRSWWPVHDDQGELQL